MDEGRTIRVNHAQVKLMLLALEHQQNGCWHDLDARRLHTSLHLLDTGYGTYASIDATEYPVEPKGSPPVAYCVGCCGKTVPIGKFDPVVWMEVRSFFRPNSKETLFVSALCRDCAIRGIRMPIGEMFGRQSTGVAVSGQFHQGNGCDGCSREIKNMPNGW